MPYRQACRICAMREFLELVQSRPYYRRYYCHLRRSTRTEVFHALDVQAERGTRI